MNIESKLLTIANYYSQSRGVGHTYSMRKGTDNSDCIVLSANVMRAKKEFGELKGKSIENLHLLQGLNKPLLIDHFVLERLLRDAAKEIHELRSKVLEIEAKL